jgi:putative iron-regulated protein
MHQEDSDCGCAPIRLLRAGARLLILAVLVSTGVLGAADIMPLPVIHHLDANALAHRRAAVVTYADERHREYQAIIAAGKELTRSISALLADPSPATLSAARQAWCAAHRCYSPSECHRFYGGPIDEPKADLENKLNAWPIDESCIDYVAGDAAAGLVNQSVRFPVLTPELLVARNRRGGEKNVTIGFHAIEFLLWGQGAGARGPGVRSCDDFRVGSAAANVERRCAYLTAAGDLLVAHLILVDHEWDPAVSGNYRATFIGGDVNGALRKIFTGLAALSGDELACERMAVAYETRSMEDGQSCFSFTTRDDLIANLEGIQATYLGPGAPGVGLSDLLQGCAPDLDRTVRRQLTLCLERMRAIPAPFGQSIQGDDSAPGRSAIRAAIEALEPQRLMLLHAAHALGIEIQLGKDPDHALKKVEVEKED